MCTVVLRGYEVYIIGGRNDYGTINHFLSNDLPPKNIHHLLLTSEVMMGFRVIKNQPEKKWIQQEKSFFPLLIDVILNTTVKIWVFIYLFSFLM